MYLLYKLDIFENSGLAIDILLCYAHILLLSTQNKYFYLLPNYVYAHTVKTKRIHFDQRLSCWVIHFKSILKLKTDTDSERLCSGEI